MTTLCIGAEAENHQRGEEPGDHWRAEVAAEWPGGGCGADGGGGEAGLARAAPPPPGPQLCGRGQRHRTLQGAGRGRSSCHLWGNVLEAGHRRHLTPHL